MELAVNTQEYEISYLLDPTIAETEIEAENLRIQALISQNGGMIGQTFVPQKKRLFYPVKKQTQAYLGTFYFSILAEELSGLQRALQLNPRVLRFLILNRAEIMKQEAVVVTKKPLAQEKTLGTAEEPTAKKEGTEPSFEEKLKRILKG